MKYIAALSMLFIILFGVLLSRDGVIFKPETPKKSDFLPLYVLLTEIRDAQVSHGAVLRDIRDLLTSIKNIPTEFNNSIPFQFPEGVVYEEDQSLIVKSD